MKTLFLIVFLGLFNLANSWAAFPACPQGTCLSSIKNIQDLKSLSVDFRTPTGNKPVVKIVYRRDGSGKGTLYFVNTKKFYYHYDFTQEALRVPRSLPEFNKNYEGDGESREFNLGTLVYYPKDNGPDSKEMILFELWSGDSLQADYLKEFYGQVVKNLKLGIPLIFHPLGIAQEEMMKTKNDLQIPFITTDVLYQNAKHQILNEGVAYGYLKFIEEGSEPCLDHTHIAVYKKVPNDIGVVGGVITEEFQTPLSHINIKSINRGTVNLALKNAFGELAAYKDRPVKLTVSGTGYKIQLLAPERAADQINRFWKEKRPKSVLNPKFILGSTWANKFIPLKGIFPQAPIRTNHQKMIQIMGAKATNLAVLNTLVGPRTENELGVYVPAGYGVPFDFYEEFMNFSQKNLDEKNAERVSTPKDMILEKLQAAGLLEDNRFHSLCTAKPVLKNIREMVERAQVPPRLLEMFKKHLLDETHSPIHQKKVGKIRLRSSTNSEDLEGFNGAGLYNSTGLSLYDEKDDVAQEDKPLPWANLEKKLKKKIPFVYSSVWNDRAFEEREWYSLSGKNHLNVKVGITLHRAFPALDLGGREGEGGNGVALTKNIHNKREFEKISLNGQHYDLAVTNPPLEEELVKLGEDPTKPYSTEQILVTPYVPDPERNEERETWKEWSYEILSRSSIKGGAQVLEDQLEEKDNMNQMEIRRLGRALQDLNDQFAKIYQKPKDTFILDLEWKIYGSDRKIWIKQARPLTLGGSPATR